jgi:hypothetical protein
MNFKVFLADSFDLPLKTNDYNKIRECEGYLQSVLFLYWAGDLESSRSFLMFFFFLPPEGVVCGFSLSKH